jgi:hypothetical protein
VMGIFSAVISGVGAANINGRGTNLDSLKSGIGESLKASLRDNIKSEISDSLKSGLSNMGGGGSASGAQQMDCPAGYQLTNTGVASICLPKCSPGQGEQVVNGIPVCY